VFEEGDEEEVKEVASSFGSAGAFGGSTPCHACIVAFKSAVQFVCMCVCLLSWECEQQKFAVLMAQYGCLIHHTQTHVDFKPVLGLSPLLDI
jgi:hypothetical protein